MLMATYVLLPWILLFGNYEWSTIRTATVTIFALKFWTSIWAVVAILDNKLYIALGAQMSFFGPFADSFMIVITDLIILSLYMGLPIYFLSMLAWSGERGAGQATSSAGSLGSRSEQAGSKLT